ncbi:hypothetical protein Pth03_65390 [Planotetraspora thailandica]|uniref:DUF4367 domain-containing protein n=1 Tax=Planotetraspora thailandica TaxID=487172 RepID=A0A8J3XZS2_9ACTN|nr:hypothetical protein [Planotetraspora thailandica]GII58150.1 hypothetical protein Pth03_65390 [Planotetraspora thailandica]
MSSSDERSGDQTGDDRFGNEIRGAAGAPGDRSIDGFAEPVTGLEAELLALGETLHAPAPPPADVARAVRTRLEGAREEPRPARRRPWTSPRKAVAAVAVFLAVLIAATPQGRAAVVSVLRFAGVEIEVHDSRPLPTSTPSPLPSERRVTLDQAKREVAFPVAVPSALGEPADVRIADGGRVVTLRWPGVRLDEYDGTLGVVFRKELGAPWPEQIAALPGWWIEQPHGVSYVPARSGEPEEEQVAGPTLIWQRGLVGLRLEGPDRDEALRIADSVR